MKKACKTCKIFIDGDVCPLCKRDQSTTSWQGRIVVVNPNESFIAKQMGLTAEGEYAIKVR